MPDPDVPRLIVVGAAVVARADFERAVTDRGWQISGGSGSTFGYSGPGVSGSVVTLNCGFLLTQETSPALPRSTATQPPCAAILQTFPKGIYPHATLASATGVPVQTCEIRDQASDSLGSRTTITLARPPVDPMRWRGRLQDLRRAAADYLRQGCPVGQPPQAATDIAPAASMCADEGTFGALAVVALARDNDLWLGVTVRAVGAGQAAGQARRGAAEVLRAVLTTV